MSARSTAEVEEAGRRQARTSEAMRSAPVLSADELIAGRAPMDGRPVRLWGRVVVGPAGPLRAPVTGRPCVLWQVTTGRRAIYPLNAGIDVIAGAIGPSGQSPTTWGDGSSFGAAPFGIGPERPGAPVLVQPDAYDDARIPDRQQRKTRRGLKVLIENEHIGPIDGYVSAFGVPAATSQGILLARVPGCTLHVRFGPRPG